MTLEALRQNCGDCQRLGDTKCETKSAYVQIETDQFFIHDDISEKRAPIRVLRDEHRSAQLSVYNRSGEPITVVKADMCLFDNTQKSCDCLIFNSRQLFFVEISETKNKGVKRRAAVAQFEATISRLWQCGVDYKGLEARAIICFRCNHSKPTQASMNSKKEYFRDKYNIILEEGNTIHFSHAK